MLPPSNVLHSFNTFIKMSDHSAVNSNTFAKVQGSSLPAHQSVHFDSNSNSFDPIVKPIGLCKAQIGFRGEETVAERERAWGIEGAGIKSGPEQADPQAKIQGQSEEVLLEDAHSAVAKTWGREPQYYAGPRGASPQKPAGRLNETHIDESRFTCIKAQLDGAAQHSRACRNGAGRQPDCKYQNQYSSRYPQHSRYPMRDEITDHSRRPQHFSRSIFETQQETDFRRFEVSFMSQTSVRECYQYSKRQVNNRAELEKERKWHLRNAAIPQDYLENDHPESDFYSEPIPESSVSTNSHYRSQKNWTELGLPKVLLAEIKRRNFRYPSKVQAQGIQLLLSERETHAMIQSPTGSGKTLTFVLASLSLIDKTNPNPQVICIAPSLELLNQLTEEYQCFTEVMGITQQRVYTSLNHTISQVMLMTPAQCNNMFIYFRDEMRYVRYLIVDEADHVFSESDQPDAFYQMNSVIGHVAPLGCQFFLFSATYGESAMECIQKLLPNRTEVVLDADELILENIKISYVLRKPAESKVEILMTLLRQEVPGTTLIFVNTVKFAQVLAQIINRRGYRCAILVGCKMTLNERSLTLEDLKKGYYDILVSTNLLARGIDSLYVYRVINFDLPIHWDTKLVDTEIYVHRIGRCGRFNRPGEAITIVTNQVEMKMLEEVAIHYGSTEIISQLQINP